MAIAYLERALSIVGEAGSAELRSRYLDSLGGVLSANGQKARALSALEECARSFLRLGRPAEWARTEFNIGNVCCDLAGAGDPSLWEAAIRHYTNALSVRQERADPSRFAATTQNLGTAYRESHGEDRNNNLRLAIRCYTSAFRVYAGMHLPAKCADLHNNLGNVFLELPSPPGAACKNVRRAIRQFALALRARTKLGRPCDYAVTQFNRGQAYLRLAACDTVEDTLSAATCFREAVDGFVLCGDSSRAGMARRCLIALLPQDPLAASVNLPLCNIRE
jgi:tetratricopeptide (TPR) repeat protein